MPQGTPASSQIITLTRMLEEREETMYAQAAVIEKFKRAIGDWDRAETPSELQSAEAGLLKALAIPTDSTQVLDEVRRAERERVAQMILNGRFLHDESAAAAVCQRSCRSYPSDGVNEMEKSNVRLDTNSGNGKPEQQRKLDSTMEMGQSLEGSKNKGASYIETEGVVLLDTFRGDIFQLVDSIKSLVELDMENALVPHGIGGHARNLLSSSAIRLEQLRQRVQELEEETLWQARKRSDVITERDALRQRVAELEEMYELSADVASTTLARNAELTAERDALKQQRDELLKAAQLCIKENVFAPLMKAIASVKEKQNAAD